jgi:hypothetical protein
MTRSIASELLLCAHFGQRDRLDRSNVIASIGST